MKTLTIDGQEVKIEVGITHARMLYEMSNISSEKMLVLDQQLTAAVRYFGVKIKRQDGLWPLKEKLWMARI